MEQSNIYDAILLLENKDECHRFLADLLTPQELNSINERWKICQLLDEGKLSYREINALTGASLATIGRVARFLKDENYKGYRAILERLKGRTK